ncbi:MAG TPA: hypothetical protein VEH27_12095 [Methylomirabilota bacterium]|nr:hypothetical protein [Methylomirabilota bacterium]
MANAVDFLIRLTMNSSGVKRGADAAAAEIQRVSRAALNMAAGFVGVNAMTGLSHNLMDLAGRMVDLSAATGISTDKLQAWEYAAKQSGSSVEAVAKGLKDIQLSMVAAVGGNEKELDAFARMGVSLQDLKTKRPEDIFEQVARHIGNAGQNAQVTADAVALLGKSSQELMPALTQGFQDAAESAASLGLVIENDVLKRIDSVGDHLETMGGQIKAGFAVWLDWMVRRFNELRSIVAYGAAWLGTAVGDPANPKIGDLAHEAGKAAAMRVFDDEAAVDARGRGTGASSLNAATVAGKVAAEVSKQVLAVTQVRSSVPADQFTRMGIFLGGFDQTRITQERQLMTLKRIESEISGLRLDLTREKPTPRY